MKNLKLVLIITIIILAFISFPVAAQTNNLVKNPGFEENEGNDPYFWLSGSWENKGKLLLDKAQAHSGRTSALIINDTATDSRFKQQINVKGESYYKLSCWVKTENVGMDTKGANISIEGLIDTSVDVKDSNDWTYVELFGVTGKDQKSFMLTIGLGGYSSVNTGKAWFDDITVEELNEPPEQGNVIKLYSADTGTASGSSNTSSGINTGLLMVLGAIVILAAAVFLILNLKKPVRTGKAESSDISSVKSSEISSNKLSSSDFASDEFSSNKISSRDTADSPIQSRSGCRPQSSLAFRPFIRADKKDWIIMASMTFIYLLLAVLNLGSLKAPVTSWTPAGQGESIVIDLGREITPGPVYFYSGLGHNRPNIGKYRVQYLESQGVYKPLSTLEKNEGNIFTWQHVNSPDALASSKTDSETAPDAANNKQGSRPPQEIKTRYLKLLVDAPGGTLNELVFFEKGSKNPLRGVKIIENNTSPEDEGNVENLFDETDTVDYSHSYLSGMIFDEIYHARTAYEYLNRMEPYEWTHPPLGKIFISLGILVFGMNPFGWRIVGTLFGVAMIPVMYLFGRKLFGGRFYGFCAAFLMMFDFMHFGLTRIATIDVYGTFFIMLMYYYMFDYFTNKSWQVGFRKSLKPLFLSGLFFGLGAASKWIGLYAGGGLALLFFLAKYSEYRDYAKEKVKKGKKAAWLDDFIPAYMIRTFIYCVIFFIIIPGVIYVFSYIPYINAPGHDVSIILSNQAAMFKYHSKDVLSATHTYSSLWWEWPIIRRPLLTYYGSDLPAGMSSSMTIMGNPAIWWIGIIAIIASVIIAIKKRDKKMTVVFTAIAFQYLPWIGITRIVFIYHFFSSVPFMILSIVYIIKHLTEKSGQEMKYVIYGYLALVFVLFVLFYPVLSGLEVPRNYVMNYLQWFKSKWVF